MKFTIILFLLVVAYFYYRSRKEQNTIEPSLKSLEIDPISVTIENSELRILTNQLYMHYKEDKLVENKGDPAWENQAFHFCFADEKFERMSLPPNFREFNKKYFYIKNTSENLSLMTRDATPWFGMEGLGKKHTFMNNDTMVLLRELEDRKVIQYIELVNVGEDNCNILSDKENYIFLINHKELEFYNNEFHFKDDLISISDAYKYSYLVVLKLLK